MLFRSRAFQGAFWDLHANWRVGLPDLGSLASPPALFDPSAVLRTGRDDTIVKIKRSSRGIEISTFVHSASLQVGGTMEFPSTSCGGLPADGAFACDSSEGRLSPAPSFK